MEKSILLSIVFIPTIGAFLLPFFGKISKLFRNIMALLFSSSSFFLSLLLIQSIFVNDQIIQIDRHMPLGFSSIFVGDKLALFMALVSSFISAVIVLYSFGYIEQCNNQNEYYLMVVLFLGAMMGLVFAGNLIVLYVFWEITSLVSWRLIGFYREKHQVLRADKSFLMTVFGALMMLLGFMMLYNQAGSFDLDAIRHSLGGHPVSGLAV
ncbi:MAG: proton-conducting transporter membrane subunit, partial [Candidatus Wallbacteria bacterium]|nr:proton-conducting transporter membrane subunit [Candidatus Wallbacteria bacterium]